MLTKRTDARHALRIRRRDGTGESVELETRSVLLHDLTHFAVESALGTDRGVFGALAAGRTFAELAALAAAPDAPGAAAMMEIERAVAVLQGTIRSGESPAAAHARIAELQACQDARLPSWFTVAFVATVHEALRRLLGQWRATPFGGSMALTWPPAST